MGHIHLSESDIEFVVEDDDLLDDTDVELVDERVTTPALPLPRAMVRPLPMPSRRMFDDAQTHVWRIAAAR